MEKALRILVFCETNTTYGRGILEGLTKYAHEHNWILSFEQRGRSERPFGRYTPLRADGIITRTYHRSMYDILRESGLPMVELLGQVDRDVLPAVTMDEKYLAHLITDHFLERGLRRFAYYCMEDAPLFYPRREYFLEYLEQLGYPCEVYPTQWAQSDYVFPRWREKYRPKLAKWLQSLKKPVALYASLDQCGQVILELCQELGIRVPQEISLVAVGNDEWVCRLLRPSLSSVDGNSYVIGYHAAQILDRKIKQEPVEPKTLFIPASFLAVRQSSDFYSVGDPDIEHALTFIRENACQRIQLRDILHEVNISQRTLYRGFAKYLNRTPQSEILRVQMETACQLLRETNFSVAAVAHRCGFSNDIYFVQAFRRERGVTPNAYRQQCRYGTFSNDVD
ncbi:MAG: DNA-binding transcriptional regulator [Planctomycetia bacterium]|nr:DNA-binding transcriptional regulator [Planctomycetia bacterium]